MKAKARVAQRPQHSKASDISKSSGKLSVSTTSEGAPAESVQLAHVVLIVLAAVLVYSNTLHNEFHLDDFYRVVDNPGIQKVSPIWRHFVDPATSATLDRLVQFRPLLPLSLSLNYYLTGDSLPGYHIGNLLLQVIASVLVYFLVLELLRHWDGRIVAPRRQGLLALAVAAIFAVHPVSGITVNYIAARDILLMQVFFSGSLLAYLHMRRKGPTVLRWGLVLILLALSMLSKQNSVVTPLLVLVFELTAGRQKLSSVTPWLRALPFAAVIAAFFLYTKLVLRFSDTSNVLTGATGSVWEYPLTQAKLHLFHYFKNFFWPFSIRQGPLIEPAGSLFDPQVFLGGVFILGTLWIAWRVRQVWPLLSFCILAYWVLMIPESSVLPLHNLAVDYRPYPSSPYLFLAGALVLDRYGRSYLLPAGMAVTAVAYFGVASFLLNRTWRTEESLWSHSVKHGGEALAHLNLAMSIEDRKDPRVRANLEEALRLNPDYIVAQINLGLLLIDQRREDEGLNHIRTAVSREPSRAQSHYWLARAYARLGRMHEAAQSSAEAARLAPRNIEYQYQAILDAQNVEDYAGSLAYIRAVEAIESDYRDLLFLKGFALRRLGKVEEAIAAYRAFIAQQPDHFQAQFNLGYALMISNWCGEAIRHFENTLALKADYSETHLHLTTCYAKLGNTALAAKHRELYGKQSTN